MFAITTTNINKATEKLFTDIMIALFISLALQCCGSGPIYLAGIAAFCIFFVAMFIIAMMMYELYRGIKTKTRSTYAILCLLGGIMAIPAVTLICVFKETVVAIVKGGDEPGIIALVWPAIYLFLFFAILLQWIREIVTVCLVRMFGFKEHSKIKAYCISCLGGILSLVILVAILTFCKFGKLPEPLFILCFGAIVAFVKYLVSRPPFDEDKARDVLYGGKTSYVWLMLCISAYVFLHIMYKPWLKVSDSSPQYEAACQTGVGIMYIMFFVWFIQNILFDTCFGSKILHDLRKKFGIEKVTTRLMPGYGSFCDSFFWLIIFGLPVLVWVAVVWW